MLVEGGGRCGRLVPASLSGYLEGPHPTNEPSQSPAQLSRRLMLLFRCHFFQNLSPRGEQKARNKPASSCPKQTADSRVECIV